MALVMGVLIVSFGIWGIADIFRGFGQSTLAKVGHTEISTNEFRQIYTDRLQQIGRQFGRPLTQEQARAFGFDRQVLTQTIAEAALDEKARQLGLNQSNAASAMICCSTWRSKPKARACSWVSGRPNCRPICCSRSV